MPHGCDGFAAKNVTILLAKSLSHLPSSHQEVANA